MEVQERSETESFRYYCFVLKVNSVIASEATRRIETSDRTERSGASDIVTSEQASIIVASGDSIRERERY